MGVGAGRSVGVGERADQNHEDVSRVWNAVQSIAQILVLVYMWKPYFFSIEKKSSSTTPW